MDLITELFLAAGLLICGIQDIKKRQVSILVILAMAFYAVGHNLYCNSFCFPDSLLAIAPGILMIFVAFISKESIGYGDGLLILCLGLFENLENIIFVCILAVSITGIFAMVLVLLCHKNKKYEIAFVPFLVLGYGIMKGMS